MKPLVYSILIAWLAVITLAWCIGISPIDATLQLLSME